MDISVVVPLFNEEESIPELYAWIEKVMKANGFSYEVIFVMMVVPTVHGRLSNHSKNSRAQ